MRKQIRQQIRQQIRLWMKIVVFMVITVQQLLNISAYDGDSRAQIEDKQFPFLLGPVQMMQNPVLVQAQQQGAKIYGKDKFQLEYSLGYLKLTNGVGQSGIAQQTGYYNEWPGKKVYIVRNTQKNGNIYIDWYNGAVYKDKYYDVREYLWVNEHEAAIAAYNGAAGQALAPTTENWLVRELHFYESGTLKSGQPKEVQWKGIVQLQDNDLNEGYTINNIKNAYLAEKTSLRKTATNTWRGTWDGGGLHDHQYIWAEVYGNAQKPLKLTYWIGKQHVSGINFGPTKYSGTVTYKPNGGQGTDFTQIIQLGYDQTTARNQFTRTDYVFTGWNTKADGTGTAYKENTVYSFSSSITLYAQWKKLTYTVKFNGNGSTSGQMQNQIINRIDSTPLSKNQYQRKFKVTYNANGGTQSKEQDTTNQKFNGWAKTQTGQVVYTDQQAVTNIAPANGSITLYAKWTDNKVTLPNCNKDKYQFKGWITDSGAYVGSAGKEYTVQKNTTLYAKYAQMVVYDKNESKVAQSSVNGTLPSQYELQQTQITLEEKGDLQAKGYRFIGWSLYATPSEAQILEPGQTISNLQQYISSNGVLTIYAIWEKLTGLTIDPNGGTWVDSSGVVVQSKLDDSGVDKNPTGETYNSKKSFTMGKGDTKVIQDPVRTGYSFFGWMIS